MTHSFLNNFRVDYSRFYYLLGAVFFLALAVASVLLETATKYDFLFSRFFYDAINSLWLMDKSNQLAYVIFYSGIKACYGILWLVFLLLLLFKKIPEPNKSGVKIFLWSVLWSSIVIGLLKSSTNMACPKDLVNFGGNIVYKSLFESYNLQDMPEQVQRCFPAGHAGFGFSFFSLMFIAHQREIRFLIGFIALIIGTSMGLYKMLIGDHFMSHTLVSLFLSLAITHLVAYFVLQNPIINSAMKGFYARSSSLMRQRKKRAPSPPVAAR